MDLMTNGNGQTVGGIGWVVFILLALWFFGNQNQMPNGYCQDMSNQCASAIATQTTLNGEIRNQKEFCELTTEVFQENEKTRDKLDSFRDEYQRDQLAQARFAQQKADFENSMLRQQLVTQGQFNDTNARLAQISCECLKRPPVYPYVCTPCPVNPCNGLG